MTTVQPNPYSPYATADPRVRHLFPTLFGPPEAGALLPTGCRDLAVVPDEPQEIVPPAEQLPAGVCPGCAAALRGLVVFDSRPVAACRNCDGETRHNQLCAVCRADAHELWVATRVAAVPPPAPLSSLGPFQVLGGPIRSTRDAFCEHGDFAFLGRLHVQPLQGDQERTTLDLILPRCYLAKVFGAVLAVVDEDPNPQAQDRFAVTVTEAQASVRHTLQQRATRDENGTQP
ncbi:hypothetical protein [Streptomyces sp. NPDC048386]|uniref:hypothetical protein n=1 Tax=Streptomyces sp. NPDC048386 TaxID=3365541 RepID=UPI003717D40A